MAPPGRKDLRDRSGLRDPTDPRVKWAPPVCRGHKDRLAQPAHRPARPTRPGWSDYADARFGTDTTYANPANGANCTIGQVILSAGVRGVGLVANGQMLSIAQNTALFSLIGTTYGGNGQTNFALPNLTSAAPYELTYTICAAGIFPSGN